MMHFKAVAAGREALVRTFESVRATTLALCEPLEPEDMVVQTMQDVSPAKWHLAHATWFFETLVLRRHARDYRVFDDRYHELFNSYYQSLGQPYPRRRRGLLSRPTLAEVLEYRRHVEAAIIRLVSESSEAVFERLEPVMMVGLNHEQQHQELLVMDIKNVFAENSIRPVYREGRPSGPAVDVPLKWCRFDGGCVDVGAQDTGFAYDNERPRHAALIRSFELATRLVTSGDYLEFMRDGGYQKSSLWLADGWDVVQREGWRAPLYWQDADGPWEQMTLSGVRDVDPLEPVSHVSYYEADAFATWAGHRLPTEFEWEHAATAHEITGTFLESGAYHPRPLAEGIRDGCAQLFGDVWEWTASAYSPYPGYEPFEGALGEYNGKFMINQMVLRGGSCATPRRHLRRSYRNFYYPHQRWMFAGVRLAR